MRAILVRGVLMFALASRVEAQEPDPLAGSRTEYRQAVEAYEAKDYSTFLAHARRAQALRPSHGGVTYALASAYALTGDTLGAIRALRRFAALGYSADLSADREAAEPG